MKNFTKMSMVLFDSTNAHFKLSVEAVFTKLNSAGGISPLVYVGQSGIANLNPNIYLMFTYKSDTYDKGNYLYTSYPQLFGIRNALEQVKELVLDGKAFIKDANGMLMVKPEFKDPIVLTNIGKQNKWLSFTPVITQTTEEGVTTAIPGVSIEISSTNGFASVLTIEEFLTLYTIIKDLNLANLQAMMSIAFLDCENNFGAMPQQGNYGYHSQGGYQQQYQPRQGYSAQPRQQYRPQQGQQSARQIYQQPAMPQQAAAPVQQQPQHLPPRAQEKQPVMNFDAVNETTVNYDDDAAIDEIFKD